MSEKYTADERGFPLVWMTGLPKEYKMLLYLYSEASLKVTAVNVPFAAKNGMWL